MSPEYLFSVPLDKFYYYVKLFNKREREEEEQRRQAEEATKGKDREGEAPKMVGNTIPRPQ
jgi:hypothetical protein